MAREAEVVEAAESADPDVPGSANREPDPVPPAAEEPDVLPEQLQGEPPPDDSDDPAVGPVHES